MALFVFYSLIPYKTPWCLLTIQAPILFSGSLCFRKIKIKKIFLIFLIPLINLKQVWQLNYQEPIDMQHQYVYVQTSYDVKKFLNTVNNLSRDQVIQIGTDEAWPFPYLLWNNSVDYLKYPDHFIEAAAVYLIDEKNQFSLEKKLKGKYWKKNIFVRDAREKASLYLSKAVFPSPIQFEQMLEVGK